jgi:hypothetical protein
VLNAIKQSSTLNPMIASLSMTLLSHRSWVASHPSDAQLSSPSVDHSSDMIENS